MKIFRRDFFVSQCRKFSVGVILQCFVIFEYEKVFCLEGYFRTFDFLSKFFCLTVPKLFVGEPFCAVFQKVSGSEKVCG